MIYFVHAAALGLTKIGTAGNPRRRLYQLQCNSPCALVLLGLEEGGKEREAELHAIFSEYRARGEWFHHTGRLKLYVETLEPAVIAVRARKKLAGPLGEYLYEHELTLEKFGKRIGLSGAQVSRIISADSRPSFMTAFRIERETGGTIPMAAWAADSAPELARAS